MRVQLKCCAPECKEASEKDGHGLTVTDDGAKDYGACVLVTAKGWPMQGSNFPPRIALNAKQVTELVAALKPFASSIHDDVESMVGALPRIPGMQVTCIGCPLCADSITSRKAKWHGVTISDTRPGGPGVVRLEVKSDDGESMWTLVDRASLNDLIPHLIKHLDDDHRFALLKALVTDLTSQGRRDLMKVLVPLLLEDI